MADAVIQDDLFSQPPAVAAETSKAAAEQIVPNVASLRRAVYDFLRIPATDEEIAHGLALNPSTARPRRVELVAAGLVRDSGTRRRTVSGRQAIVWERSPEL